MDDHSVSLSLRQPDDLAVHLGGRVRDLRLGQDLTLATLARMAGVSAVTVRRFETTGRATVETLMRIAAALGRLEDFGDVLAPPPADSIDEVERRQRPRRRRGRR